MTKTINIIDYIQQCFVQKDYNRTISLCEKFLEQRVDLAVTETLAISYAKIGRHDQAVRYFQKITDLLPYNNSSLLYNISLSLTCLERYSEAIDCLQEALKANESFHEARIQLGLVHYYQKNYMEAKCQWELAVSQQPNNFETWINLALLYRDHLLLPDEMLRCCRNASSIKNIDATSLLHLGKILMSIEEYSLAEQVMLRAADLMPSNSEPSSLLGAIAYNKQDPAQSVFYYDKALAKDPGNLTILGNRSQAILLSGDWARGFSEYEWRKEVPFFAPVFDWFRSWPEWQGEIFSNETLLIYDEQGMGDMLQFIRYLPQVKARGGNLIVSAKAPLIRLLQQQNCADLIIKHTQEELSKLHFNKVLPLMSLPYIFGTTTRTVPNMNPYIFPCKKLVSQWSDCVPPSDGKMRIGLVWAGNPKHTEALHRTSGLRPLLALSDFSGAHWISLQKGNAAKDAHTIGRDMGIIDFTDDIEDFADTAAIIANLDLVISIDTAVAHLAGAMGKPTWTLLPFASEWRWLVGADQTPWYPTMKLFRQTSPKDWYTPIQQILAELRNIKPRC